MLFWSLVLCGAFVLPAALAASAEEWKSRSIYQVLTDRFAQPTDTFQSCGDISNYCGGTFSGIVNHLDYIQGMGFDAVWISPVVANTPRGYHGYWAQDLYSINPNYGTADELRALSDALHARGMYLMIDIVGNHMGGDISGISELVPFNRLEQYHDCAGCQSDCNIHNFFTYPETEHCRLANLPDLNHQDAGVRATLLDWAAALVANYSVDGLRIDTVPEVPVDFWAALTQRTGVYTVGEVFNGDVKVVSPYQGPLSAPLSYPLFYTLRNVFGQQQSATQISAMRLAYNRSFKDIDLLGTFVDNHDNVRFLNMQSNTVLYRNALTYVLLSPGIPIVYYGSEQLFSGGNDPQCREPLWTSKYATDGAMYQHLATVNAARTKFSTWTHAYVESYATDHAYAFFRGYLLVLLGNRGAGAPQFETLSITRHPYSAGAKLCSLLFAADCPTVGANGAFEATLFHGEPNLYAPATAGI